MAKRVQIVENIMNANDQLAFKNNTMLTENNIFAINIMASPGAGKTSFILKTIENLPESIRLGVIEGDTAPVTIDADKVQEVGIPVVQINTGGECHLSAVMVETALQQLPLKNLDLIMVENVGNLICPAAFRLGTHANVLIASIPEGDDKPYKYPGIYRELDALILNKIDLLPFLDFRVDYFLQGVKILNPGVKIFEVSCKTGAGIPEWITWLTNKIHQSK